MITTIITFIIVFGVLVFVHEFGHYFFAKRSGILVREFSIGMGPKIYAYHKNGTTYTLRILPLGGYVRMAGLEDDEDSLKKGQPISLLLDDNGIVRKINASSKMTLLNAVPLEVSAWDLDQELWIKGYENGDETKEVTYQVDHDAMIIEPDGTEVQIAPLDVQFQSAALPNRMMTNFAGAMNNFLLAIVAFALVAIMQGGVITNTTTLGQVQHDSVAQKAGLKKGDTVVSINGEKVADFSEMAAKIDANPGKKLVFKVKRGKDQVLNISLKPKTVTEEGKKSGKIGVVAKQAVNRSPIAIAEYGFVQTWNVMKHIFAALGAMLHGFSLNDLGGPVAMYSYTSKAAQYGVVSVISLLAFLSVNLGIVNLLPIPALDGGKLLLNVIEAVRGKPIDPNKEVVLTLIGFAFMLILMFLVTWNDIQRYFFR